MPGLNLITLNGLPQTYPKSTLNPSQTFVLQRRQPTNQPTNRPTDQPTNQPTTCQGWRGVRARQKNTLSLKNQPTQKKTLKEQQTSKQVSKNKQTTKSHLRGNTTKKPSSSEPPQSGLRGFLPLLARGARQRLTKRALSG